jgi:molybdopterin converting factor small subunit
MKITVKFLGMPNVAKIVGRKSVPLDFPGRTVSNLIEHIVDRYGPKVRKFLLDKSGRLDISFQVLLNGKEWISRKKMKRILKDGDIVRIMMLVAGG